jgi:hypothetical protein
VSASAGELGSSSAPTRMPAAVSSARQCRRAPLVRLVSCLVNPAPIALSSRLPVLGRSRSIVRLSSNTSVPERLRLSSRNRAAAAAHLLPGTGAAARSTRYARRHVSPRPTCLLVPYTAASTRKPTATALTLSNYDLTSRAGPLVVATVASVDLNGNVPPPNVPISV